MEVESLCDKVTARLTDLQTKKTRLIEYLDDKKTEADWHGCCDAANDIRDIEAETLGLEWVLKLCQK